MVVAKVKWVGSKWEGSGLDIVRKSYCVFERRWKEIKEYCLIVDYPNPNYEGTNKTADVFIYIDRDNLDLQERIIKKYLGSIKGSYYEKLEKLVGKEIEFEFKITKNGVKYPILTLDG